MNLERSSENATCVHSNVRWTTSTQSDTEQCERLVALVDRFCHLIEFNFQQFGLWSQSTAGSSTQETANQVASIDGSPEWLWQQTVPKLVYLSTAFTRRPGPPARNESNSKARDSGHDFQIQPSLDLLNCSSALEIRRCPAEHATNNTVCEYHASKGEAAILQSLRCPPSPERQALRLWQQLVSGFRASSVPHRPPLSVGLCRSQMFGSSCAHLIERRTTSGVNIGQGLDSALSSVR